MRLDSSIGPHATRVALVVNEANVEASVPAGESLLHFLRRRVGLTGPKEACGRGECGACTVLIDEVSVMSCVMLASQVRGPVTTIEGLATRADDLREEFANCYGFQCGYCTPGQIVRAEAVLSKAKALDRTTVAEAMSGNICRCTGYAQIVDAVLSTATKRGIVVDPDEAST